MVVDGVKWAAGLNRWREVMKLVHFVSTGCKVGATGRAKFLGVMTEALGDFKGAAQMGHSSF